MSAATARPPPSSWPSPTRSRTPAFVTAFYGVYNPKTRVLSFSNAGHPPPRIVRGQRILQLETARGLPLGVEESEHYTDARMQLEPDDFLLLYTDGISEAFNMSSQLFGFARLDQSLTAKHKTARSVIDNVLNSVNAFAQGRPPADDQTMLAMHVLP